MCDAGVPAFLPGQGAENETEPGGFSRTVSRERAAVDDNGKRRFRRRIRSASARITAPSNIGITVPGSGTGSGTVSSAEMPYKGKPTVPRVSSAAIHRLSLV